MTRLPRSRSGLFRVLHLALASGVVVGGGALTGCSTVDTPPIATPPAPSTISLFGVSSVQQVDLLLMIDSSRSMADKQQILAFAIPDLVGELLNPPCVDAIGTPTATKPSDPLASCPPGAHRTIVPITDIHVGIVTSSLGGHGSDSCSVAGDTQSCPGGPNPSNNDAGHLVARKDACGGAAVPTYGSKGFLAWDPAQQLSPPGDAHLGSLTVAPTGTTTTATPGLLPSLKDLVVGVGQLGCGYTSQLESWYRFLVDPDPYESIVVDKGTHQAMPQGTDTLLLKQRADFLRRGSLLSIVMLTDGNDCSIKESGQFYYAAQQQSPGMPGAAFHLPRARKECATNPDDSCCKSCAQSAPNCPVDDACTASPTLTDAEDPVNLRCFDQKRRFGIDFLYPIARYTEALRSPMIADRQGDMVTNPLFMDLGNAGSVGAVRDPSLVFLTGIVGVPWQDLARDPADPTKGNLDSEELAAVLGSGSSAWDRILGDPQTHTLPTDPHMIESVTPRAGLPAPGSAPGADPVSGHEYTTGDDLQYACIFGLPAPRDCSSGNVNGCDCGPGTDNPVCDPTTPTTQLRAKAYPSLRELATLKALGTQGIVGSICPTQISDPSRADYGYRLAVNGILGRLASGAQGLCLARKLTPDAQGLVQCTVVEGRVASPSAGSVCTCDAARALREVPAAKQTILADVKASPLAKSEGLDCFCEVVAAGDPVDSSPEELLACRADASDPPSIVGGKDGGALANGWCYVDPTQNPTSNPEIVKGCPADEKQMIRFAGNTLASTNAVLFIDCAAQ
jgi:hypothetical protein